MYIDRVTFYTVDYGEEDLVVPSVAHRTTALIPTGLTFIATDIYCGRDEVFSYFKVAQNYELLWNRNYMKVEIAASTGETTESVRDWYGWIDSIECISDTPGSYVCAVKWHPDYWRTFIGSVKGGGALVTRRKYVSSEVPGTSRPIQNVPYLYHTLDTSSIVPLSEEETLTTGDFHIMHAVMAYIDGTGTAANLRYAVWPVGVKNPSVVTTAWQALKIHDYSSESSADLFPNVYEMFGGDVGTLFNIQPSQVKGLWVSFTSPFDFEIIHQADDVYKFRYKQKNGGQLSAGYMLNNRAYIVNTYRFIIDRQVRNVVIPSTHSDEFTTVAVFDETGTMTGSFPPGMVQSGGFETWLAVSSAGCYQVVRAKDSSEAASQGCEVRIPCMAVPVTDNSFADYLYSGQRAYEIDAKRLQITTGFYKSLIGASSSGAEGAMAGAIAGKNMAGPLAALGAASGVVSAIGSTIIDASTADQLQSMTDTAKAAQGDELLFYGGTLAAFGDLYPCFGPFISWLDIDNYSKSQWESYATQYGIEVQETKSDIISYMSTYTGPLQVRNAQLGGVPSRAVKYIKQRLNSGVIFI